ncbi:MAG: excinuclease ABC subunit UvrA [Defluviitaleaceae bacterium]|nr:excinuclease ABC subunit UvrA [Defluviitaleaceae bacterium]
MSQKIVIKGAREHNLKNIDVEIPRDKMVVFTGVSGSGKSSLAFETIYAEGQRRYVESLSSYARQFLGQMDKPDVDSIEGLSPAISIDQKTTNHNPRSTVGTVTEIYDYLRLLYARVGVPHCHKCGKVIEKQTIDQIVDKILALPERSRISLLAPVVHGRKGEHTKLLEDARRSGYVRVRIDGITHELSDEIKPEKNKKHDIEIVIDRLVVKNDITPRLTGSCEAAMTLSGGILLVSVEDGEELMFSQNFACADCGVSMQDVEPRMFSFNNPSGACPECFGLGIKMIFDEELVVPNKQMSLAQGAVKVPGWFSSGNENSHTYALFKSLAHKHNFDMDAPYASLPDGIRHMLMNGDEGKVSVEFVNQQGDTRTYSYQFEGIMNSLERRYKDTQSEFMRGEYEALMTGITCPMCAGKRLRPEVLAVTVGGINISELTDRAVGKLNTFFRELDLGDTKRMIAEPILREIHARTGFLVDVGLDYLSLSRNASTLSGGESQRIRLATQIGSGLVGVVYILDEPSIGLHQRDNDKLLKTLEHLRDIGNTLIVVEHDEDTMLAADHIIDIGPLAGSQGGRVVFSGKPRDIMKCKESVTGAYLSGKQRIEVPAQTREPNGKWLKLTGCAENNLQNIDVSLPLGLISCVTGVSGSGKSSLVNEILYKSLARDLNRAKLRPGKHTAIEGLEFLDKIINIDQSPIGRTPRSNPATYTGLFDLVRDIFAATPEAKLRGYAKGRFSFNVKGGRCEACSGDGIIKIAMHFLPDIYVPCEVCAGKRYNRETLEVRYKGKNIADVLDMTIEEALTFFENLPRLHEKLRTICDVGLTYVKLGQASTTLSGGEAQRVKLATELSRRMTGKTIYVLDEPTTGLHAADVHRLTHILQRLADSGNTVVVIEHNLDVIKTADYIVDLGPEGGDRGGQVIARGTPREVANNKDSHTGMYLKRIIAK